MGKCARHVESIHCGHQNIKHDEVGFFLTNQGGRSDAVACFKNFTAAFFQREGDETTDVGIAIGDDNATARAWSLWARVCAIAVTSCSAVKGLSR